MFKFLKSINFINLLMKRDIGNIVKTFTKAQEELKAAIKEEECVINKSKTDALSAEAKCDEKIKQAELKLKSKKDKAQGKLKVKLEKTLNDAKTAKSNIEEAKKWLAKIPSVD